MNKSKVVAGLVAAVLLMAVMVGCGSNEPEVNQPQYTTVPVERGDVIRTVYVPGELVLTDTFTLSSPVDSELLDLLVKPGEQVKKGDILAHLDEDPFEDAYEDAVAQAEAELEAAKSDLEAAKSNLECAEYNLMLAQYGYQQALRAEDDTDPEEMELARMWTQLKLQAMYLAEDNADVAWDALKAAKKALNTAKEALKQTKKDKYILDEADIRAPCDGMVLDIKFREGDMVTKDSPIIVLADLNQMELRVTIGQDNIISIKPGLSAEINLDSLPGETLKGKVDYMLPQKSTTSQTVTYEVYLSLGDVDDGLLPGMTGGATILVAEKHDVLRIPRRLVKIAPDGSGRVEVLEQGQPVFREVVIGVRGDTHYEIVSGLSEGDLVIQRGRF